MYMERSPVGWWSHSLMRIRQVVHKLLVWDTRCLNLPFQNTVGKVKPVQECTASTHSLVPF
jgi:hypothetical protein